MITSVTSVFHSCNIKSYLHIVSYYLHLQGKDLPNDQTKVLYSFPKQKDWPAHTDEITINTTV